MSEPWHFFWATGGLSAFLHNAPTYVVFFETATVLPAGGETLALTGGTENRQAPFPLSRDPNGCTRGTTRPLRRCDSVSTYPRAHPTTPSY